jgi:hypothetical protein
MEKTGSESYSGYAWAEESLLLGGVSPVTISNGDDDLVSVNELFVKAGPTPTTATATAIPAAGTHKRQISEAVPRDERPNGPETTPTAPLQQEAQGGSQEAQGADIGTSIAAGAGNNTRKSSRARKPRRRD